MIKLDKNAIIVALIGAFALIASTVIGKILTIPDREDSYLPTNDMEIEITRYLDLSGGRVLYSKLAREIVDDFAKENSLSEKQKAVFAASIPQLSDFRTKIMETYKSAFSISEIVEMNRTLSQPQVQEFYKKQRLMFSEILPLINEIMEEFEEERELIMLGEFCGSTLEDC